MSSKECEEQLNSLIEHFNNGGLDFNTTDIEAIKHLLLENKMQHDQINCLKEKLQQREEVIEEAIEFINNARYDKELKTIAYGGLNVNGINGVLDILNQYKKEEIK